MDRNDFNTFSVNTFNESANTMTYTNPIENSLETPKIPQSENSEAIQNLTQGIFKLCNENETKVYGPDLPPPLPFFPRLERERLKEFIKEYSKPHTLSTKLYNEKESEATFVIEAEPNMFEGHPDLNDILDVEFSLKIYAPNNEIVGDANNCSFYDDTIHVESLKSYKKYKRAGTAIIEAIFRISVLTGRRGNIKLISGFCSNLFYFKLGFRSEKPLNPILVLYKTPSLNLRNLWLCSFCKKLDPQDPQGTIFKKTEKVLRRLTLPELNEAKQRIHFLSLGTKSSEPNLSEVTAQDVLDNFYENTDEFLRRISGSETSPDLTMPMYLTDIGKASFWPFLL